MYTINIGPLICENCGKEHNGEFGSGRFCSLKCATKFGSRDALKNIPESKQPEFYKNTIHYKFKNSSRIGKLAEIAVIKKFTEYNILVALPELNNGIDLLIKINKSFIPIQVMASSRIGGKYNNIIRFSLTKHTLQSIDNGSIIGYHRKYPEDRIHYFALYDIIKDEIYLVRNKNINKNIMLHRNIPEDNNNPLYKYCNDYKFDNVIHNIINEYSNKSNEFEGDCIYVKI